MHVLKSEVLLSDTRKHALLTLDDMKPQPLSVRLHSNVAGQAVD